MPPKPRKTTVPRLVVAFLLDPESFVLWKPDGETSASGIPSLNGLQWVLSDKIPRVTPGCPAISALSGHVLEHVVAALADDVFDRVLNGGDVTIEAGVFEELYSKLVQPHSRVPCTQVPKAGVVIRSSSNWSRSEAKGQRDRLRQVLREMLRRGYFPRLIVADSESGSHMARPGLMSVLEEARMGKLQGVYIHTLERYSRNAKVGVLMLVLAHWLTGNLVYLSSGTRDFVAFDSRDPHSLLEAAEEILDGAKEGQGINDRLLDGARGLLVDTRAYVLVPGQRLFHGPGKMASPPARGRSTPKASYEMAGQFHVMAHVLGTTRRPEAWEAFAFWHGRTKAELETELCSEWNGGNLVLAVEDWKPNGRGFLSQRRPPELEVSEMRLCERVTLDQLRETFAALHANPRQRQPGTVIARQRMLKAFREAFDPVIQHLATGRFEAFLNPAGGPDGVEVRAPSRLPLVCPVCITPAYLVRARKGDDVTDELVCAKDASHRGPPLRYEDVHRAMKLQSGPACSYCGTFATKYRRSQRMTATVFFYECPKCPELTITPVSFNMAARLKWIEAGSRSEAYDRQATINGWTSATKATRSRDEKPRELSEAAFEVLRIDRALDGVSREQLLGRNLLSHKGPPLERDMLRLRCRILEDVVQGVVHPPSFYEKWMVRYLGTERRKARFTVFGAFQFLRKRKHAVFSAYPKDRRAERAELHDWLLEDYLDQGIQPDGVYVRRLNKQFVESGQKYRNTVNDVVRKFKSRYAGPHPRVRYIQAAQWSSAKGEAVGTSYESEPRLR